MYHPVPPTVSLNAFLPAGETKLPDYPPCLLVEQKTRQNSVNLRQRLGDFLIHVGLKIKGQPVCAQSTLIAR